MKEIWMVIYYWVNKCPYGFISNDLELSKNSIVQWANKFCFLCTEVLIMDSKPIGGIMPLITIKHIFLGPGKIVAIDESKFAKLNITEGEGFRAVDIWWNLFRFHQYVLCSCP